MDLFELIFALIILIFFLLFMFWPISIPIAIWIYIKRRQNKKIFQSMVIENKKQYYDISPSKLEGFDISDLSNLKMYLTEKFLAFENAFNKLDFNTMYNICTEKMYNLYHSNITVNLKFEEKKIIDQIEIKKVIILDTYSSKYKQVVSAMIEISNLSYMMKSNGKIVSGSSTEPITEAFEVTFIKNFKQNDKYKCPNCGAPVEGTTCEYCKSKITSAGDYRIDSIKKIVK